MRITGYHIAGTLVGLSIGVSLIRSSLWRQR